MAVAPVGQPGPVAMASMGQPGLMDVVAPMGQPSLAWPGWL